MTIAGDISFKIDNVLMTYQPSGIEEIFSEPIVHNVLGGSRVVSEPTQPANIVATWGVEAARGSAITELRPKRSTSGSPTISYSDISGTTQTKTIYMPKIGYSQFLLANAVEQVAVTFVVLG